MNGRTNGLYDGLLTGQANGLFDGLGNGLHNGLFNNETPYITGYIDLDAQRFINTIGTLTNQQANAINLLVIRLKNFNLWNKCKAIYPFVGGTASTNKFNLKDPRDTNAAFRLSFVGGWTHSNNGALPNGTNAYANTFLSPSGNQSLTSGHFSIYSRTSIASTSTFGANGIRNQTTSLGSQLGIRRLDNARFFIMWDEGTGGVAVATTETNAQGFYLGSRIANNNLVYYKNGLSIASNTTTQTASSLSAFNYYLAAVNESNSIGATYDNKQIAFSSIGDGLNQSEQSIFYNIIQNYQILLGRNV